MIRKHIIFYGFVQGVGFRWTAMQAANRYSCTGWVTNEYDGSVSMEIQGEEESIDRVILSLEQGRFIHIDNMDVKTIPVDEDERSFGVH